MSLVTELPRATWLIFRMHLGTIAGSRRTLVCIVLAAIPPLLGFLVARFAAGEVEGGEILAFLGMLVLLQVVVPLLGVSLGVGAIADEAESRTITYPFTRPIPRASLFLGRWLATAVVVLALLSGSLVGLGLAAASAGEGVDTDALRGVTYATLLGGLVYSLGAAVIGIVAKRGLIIALGYAFAVEIIIGNLPGSTQKLTIQYHLRSLFFDKDLDPWTKMDPFHVTEFLPPAEAFTKMAVLAVLLLAFGSWRVSRKQFVLSS